MRPPRARRPRRRPSRRAGRGAPGSRRSSSQAGASSPSTIAAVLAVLASTHDAAATVTVRHGEAAGLPVRGSTMWCSSPPAVAQRRTVVPELASPPDMIETAGPGASSGAAWSSAMPDRPASRRRLSGDRDVAAEAHEHAGPGRVRRCARRAIGGERLRRRAEVELDPSRGAHRAARLAQLDLAPPRGGLERRTEQPPVAGADDGHRPVVAGKPQRVDPRSGRRARRWPRRRAAPRAPPRAGARSPRSRPRPRAFTWTSSESERKRLQARSIASSSRSSSARAGASASGSVTATVAVVPSAGKEKELAPALTSRRT